MTGPISPIVQGRFAAARRCRHILATILVLIILSVTTIYAAEPGSDWTLESITGEKISFNDQLAKGPVVISFWATWCKPCLKELPHLNRLAGQYAGRISVLAVSTDASKSVAKVAPFIQSKEIGAHV